MPKYWFFENKPKCLNYLIFGAKIQIIKKHRVFKQVLNHISDLSCAILGPYLDHFLDTTIQNLLGHPVYILSSLRSQKSVRKQL